MSLNQITLQGRFVQDLELIQSSGKIPFTKFVFAVNRNYKDKNTKKYEADFFQCIAFGKNAEYICNEFQKGQQAIIVGRIELQKYNDKEGKLCYYTKVIVSQTFLCGPKAKNDSPFEISDGENADFIPSFCEVSDDDGELPF